MRGQIMVEFAIMLTLWLFTIAASVDLLYAIGNRGAVLMGTGYAAQAASSGQYDENVKQSAVEFSMGILRPGDVQVTPCWARQAEGLPVTIETRWYPKPLTLMLERFWYRVWGNGVTHRIQTTAIRGCKWDML